MKILFFASYPTLSIGYSRIGNILSNYLASKDNTVYYVGISNFGNETIERPIHPNVVLIDALKEDQARGSTELYGVDLICDKIEIIQPDIVFLYNDIIVISRIFNNFNQRKLNTNNEFKVFTYLDLVYPYEKVELVSHVESYSNIIFVFGEYWKNNLIHLGVPESKIKILPHGFDDNIFFPTNTSMSKKHLGFEPDDFIILNTNRNSYRKAIDKTIDSFVRFLKVKNCDPKIKLFLNMNTDRTVIHNGCNVMNQLRVACIREEIDYGRVINSHVFIKQGGKAYTDEELNILYNACDVGINTCIGEGFGLCNLEHGGIGKPQIISWIGGLTDIFNSDYSTCVEPIDQVYVSDSLDFHGGYLQLCPVDGFVDGMVKYYDDREINCVHGQKSREIICEKFHWKNILDNMYICFE